MSLSDSGGEESRKRLSHLETKIAKNGGQAALEELVAAGCDRDKLLHGLAFSCGQPIDSSYDGWFTKPGPLSLESLFGLKPRQFGAFREQLLKAAERIHEINGHFDFGVLLTTPHLKWFQPLPRLLQGYVSLLDCAAEHLGRGTHSYRNMGRAISILYVKQETGRAREDEVCTLLGAVQDDCDYDVTKHREWINDHKDLLRRTEPFVPIFASSNPDTLIESALMRPPPPPPPPPVP
jgi:hypothetical protein